MRFSTWLALVTLLPSVAFAQTTTTNPVTTILHADGEYRQAVESVFYVNAADCAAPDTVLVSVQVSSTLKTSLGSAPQIWIGTNCNTQVARDANNGTCVQASAAGPSLTNTGGGFDVPLTRMRPADSTETTYDLCNTSSQGKKTLFILPETVGSADTTTYVTYALTSDLSPPTEVSIDTTAPSGDNSIRLEWSGTVDSGSTVTYFAAAGGCGGGDGGSTSGSLTAGGAAPVGDGSLLTGIAGTGGDGDIAAGSLGLDTVGDSSAVALAVRDAAYNYSVLSNVVCAQRVATYGLCDSLGECNGGCAVRPPVGGDLASLAGLAGAIGLLAARRRR